MYKEKELNNKQNHIKTKGIYIVGAHSRARTLGVYLRKIDPQIAIAAYLVNNDEVNPETIDGVPVLHFDRKIALETGNVVYLGTRGIYHDELKKELEKMGMHNIIPVTPQLDCELRNQYLLLHFREQGRSFEKLDDLLPFSEDDHKCTGAIGKIYIIKSAFDKALQSSFAEPVYTEYLQVGAALTEMRIAVVTDDTGENISKRNKQFCELTGLYWLWKHATDEVIGLEHYRRHFLLPDDWQRRMQDHHIDVILPTPLYVAPSLAQNYRERHTASDWEYMTEYVRKQDQAEYNRMMDFFENTSLYSPCNMFIMRKEILDELCEWLFPILFACAEHGGEREDQYQNRYPGFMSERLITYYFEKNREKYKVVYADKNFLL